MHIIGSLVAYASKLNRTVSDMLVEDLPLSMTYFAVSSLNCGVYLLLLLGMVFFLSYPYA